MVSEYLGNKIDLDTIITVFFILVREKDYKVKLSICNYSTCNNELKLKDGDGKTTERHKTSIHIG